MTRALSCWSHEPSSRRSLATRHRADIECHSALGGRSEARAWHYIAPIKPVQNAFAELSTGPISFHSHRAAAAAIAQLDGRGEPGFVGAFGVGASVGYRTLSDIRCPNGFHQTIVPQWQAGGTGEVARRE